MAIVSIVSEQASYNALKFITMLFFIQKILRFNLGVAFLMSVSIVDFSSIAQTQYCIGKSD